MAPSKYDVVVVFDGDIGGHECHITPGITQLTDRE